MQAAARRFLVPGDPPVGFEGGVSAETRRLFEEGVVVSLIKPEGWTSFEVVEKVRSVVGVRKVGHAGTLDPFATGVLVVAIGRATKRISELMGLEKEYEGIIEFGLETDTLDPTGAVVRTCAVPEIRLDQLAEAAKQFVGEIEQRPPVYSALKVRGKRLYKLARAGRPVELPPRKVFVKRFDILEWQPPLAKFRVECHAGTYVRALARDLGAAVGSCGYVRQLCRTRVGPYTLENSLTIEEFAERARSGGWLQRE
ncbi:MAG: tRNA pseudouridine(55) synthase TruB [candidate division KSB1 bacterium]|nr:tRNA pseudouridine(55) synthase TruB [candidate division KSB1 bacterium]